MRASLLSFGRHGALATLGAYKFALAVMLVMMLLWLTQGDRINLPAWASASASSRKSSATFPLISLERRRIDSQRAFLYARIFTGYK